MHTAIHLWPCCSNRRTGKDIALIDLIDLLQCCMYPWRKLSGLLWIALQMGRLLAKTCQGGQGGHKEVDSIKKPGFLKLQVVFNITRLLPRKAFRFYLRWCPW